MAKYIKTGLSSICFFLAFGLRKLNKKLSFLFA